jgi:hypothetical protein
MTYKKTRSEEYAGGFPPGMEAFGNLTDPRTGSQGLRHSFDHDGPATSIHLMSARAYGGVHYLLALKANQGAPCMARSAPCSTMPSRWNTAGKRAIRSITSIREHKGEISTEKRDELSTHAAEAAKLGGLVRRHDHIIKDTIRGKRIRAALCEKTLESLSETPHFKMR